MAERTGARLLVDALLGHGVDLAFCVPGESYLAVLDALHDVRERLPLIVCRQEGGAAFMAAAHGRLTGRPGVCLVTRGPGATNASIGVHTAFQDSAPMILLIGQVGGDVVEREAFQEIDFRRMFGQMAKWVAQIDRAERIPEMLSHAFHLAVSGRPGPVVLALPEDMLVQRAQASDVPHYQRVQAHPGAEQLERLRAMLLASRQPLVILGGGGWTSTACTQMQRFVENMQLPVGCAFRTQDLFDNRHPNYSGDVGIGINPRLAQRVRDADLLLVAGARLGEVTTEGYTLVQPPRSRQKLIHVHSGAEELGRVYYADLAINSGMSEFATAAAQLPRSENAPWAEWTRSMQQDYLANLEPGTMPGTLDLAQVIGFLNRRLPDDAIVCNGAGNYSGWVHRYYQYSPRRTQLAPTCGAMGYGVPAAIAAKLAFPQRSVVSFSGDGCFLMNGQELATAVQQRLAIVFIVINNGMYGTIRLHQEREYPGRVHATDLSNPDFAKLAEAYGAFGSVVSRTSDFETQFERAFAHNGPALLELRIDPDAITTRTTLTRVREQALHAQGPAERR
jgi:acetolactate synthase I/II/III large subunit